MLVKVDGISQTTAMIYSDCIREIFSDLIDRSIVLKRTIQEAKNKEELYKIVVESVEVFHRSFFFNLRNIIHDAPAIEKEYDKNAFQIMDIILGAIINYHMNAIYLFCNPDILDERDKETRLLRLNSFNETKEEMEFLLLQLLTRPEEIKFKFKKLKDLREQDRELYEHCCVIFIESVIIIAQVSNATYQLPEPDLNAKEMYLAIRQLGAKETIRQKEVIWQIIRQLVTSH